jgi:hypothetical protein
MRERTAVKVARFVPGREGKSNLSFLFNEVPVMGMERRDCIIQFWTAVNLGNKGGTNGQNKALEAG